MVKIKAFIEHLIEFFRKRALPPIVSATQAKFLFDN